MVHVLIPSQIPKKLPVLQTDLTSSVMKFIYGARVWVVQFTWDGSSKVGKGMGLELTSVLWFNALLHAEVSKSWLEDQSEKTNFLLSFYTWFHWRIFKTYRLFLKY